jgi:hypothetical protein
MEDCVALIEYSQNNRSHGSMVVEKLWRRYGELDPRGAIKRLAATMRSIGMSLGNGSSVAVEPGEFA